MSPENCKIVLIGAGNVATHLGIALQEKKFSILQVYSRTLSSAKALGERLHTAYTDNLENLNPDASIYLFALKDSVLPEVLNAFPHFPGLFVHTAGSLPMQVFENHAEHYGVLYPLQTFSKERNISFERIPLFVEARYPDDELLLKEVANTISQNVFHLSSEKRKYLHLAAVFACNFTNHLYNLAAEILEEQSIPWEILQPLIQETAAKAEALHPEKAQTGPAIRYDQEVIEKHLSLLSGSNKELYRILSQSIHQKSLTSSRSQQESPPIAESPT